MKLNRRQLRRIILEAVSKQLYAQPLGSMGGYHVETEEGEHISTGDMVQNLLNSGDEEFFESGKDPKSLNILLSRHEEGVQGGMEKWDSEVFSGYYNVNIVKVINRYASLKGFNHQINWLGRDDEMPSDRIWREQNASPEPEYEDDGTNEFEERYS
tara:strand:+ start:53 stop:520 length:468 start_codon:yes stop_codon:yes gene_type:complete